MEIVVSKKTLKRRRQRLRRKQKSVENSLKENQLDLPEHQKQEEEMNKTPEKSKEQILAERQAKKAVKQQVRSKEPSSPSTKPAAVKKEAKTVEEKPQAKVEKPPQSVHAVKVASVVQSVKPTQPTSKPQESEKDRDLVHAEREARKLAKLTMKRKVETPAVAAVQSPLVEKKIEAKAPVSKTNSDTDLAVKMDKLHIVDDCSKAKPATKAERRAIQEAQRAAKAKSLEEKKPIVKKPIETPIKKSQESKFIPLATPHKNVSGSAPSKASALHKVKLFKHLYSDKCNLNLNVNQKIHPAIIKLGLQYESDSVVGSNARCYAFINAMTTLINDYVTPPEKFFDRGLEAEISPAVEFLQNCRPFAVSMTNALKHIKFLISQENSSDNDDDKKQRLIEKIDIYAKDQIETAATSISLKVREKISNGDVILTYGCSSLIKKTLVEAHEISKLRFKVIIVDSRPDHEGQEMLKSLAMLGINCTYVLINAISFIMPEVTKVLLGAHALLANGYVMSRCGTAQIALVANSYNVPVLVCCETHKFSERVQTDAFVFNEIGDPNALVLNKNSRTSFDHLKDWESIPHLTPLNLRYDITPPELVTAVVTEVAILPCTSVQVILRVKPAE